ncbi:MAG: phosphoribosylanthranilate isomerase [Chitinophagaceae bacterium]|nr:phosphoribosylanthranilate isomerase [Chitinophagaceae bacterium]
MNIKVCGITQLKQLQQLEGLDIDFAGFIFDKDSPRYAEGKLDKKEVKKADYDLKKVGVFVNPTYSDILDAIEDYGLDVVQLHGEETPEFCSDLNEDIEVIKAFRIDETTGSIDELVAPYDGACDYYLFDTKSADAKGGTGKQFDWSIIAKSKIEKPFFLSGGIGVADIAKIKAFKHPDFYGVDINSKVEKEPGEKDMALVLQFKLGMK